MTKYEQWSLIVAALGFIAVIVSLFFLIRQTRFVAKTLKAALVDSLSNRQYDIDKLFIDQPEIRKYFYDGADTPTTGSVEYARVTATAEYILDFFVMVLIQKDEYTDLLPRDWWLAYIKDMLTNSPVLCEVLEHRKEWYRKEELHDLKRQALESRHNIRKGIDAIPNQPKV